MLVYPFSRRCLLLILLFLQTLRLAATPPIVYLGIEQGLSNNAVTNIYQDRKGFMWFGTYDGLNRYDGYGFKVFRNNLEDSSTLCNNSVYTIEGDNSGRIWVGTQKGVSILNPETDRFERLTFSTSIEKRPVLVQDNIHIIKSAGAFILVGTQHSSLIVADSTGSGIAIASPVPGFNDVTAIDIDPGTQAIWVFIQQVGLCSYDPRRRSLHLVSKALTAAYCLRVTSDHTIWIGNDQGCFRLDPVKGTLSANALYSGSKVVNLFEDRKKRLFIASDGGGLWIKDPGSDKASPFLQDDKSAQSISSNAVYAVNEDVEERIWVGTLRGGINMIAASENPFRKITLSPSGAATPADNFILSFCEDARHNVWIGTDGAGLRYWDRAANRYTGYRAAAADPAAISSNFITNLTQDADGDLWIATWFGGINRLPRGAHQFKRYSCYNPVRKMVENNVWVVYEDHAHTLWASTTNDGTLYRFNPQQDKFEAFDEKLVNIQSLFEDRQGNFWGGNYTSLIQIDRIHHQHKTWSIGYPVRCIQEDVQGRLWIGTQGGGLLLLDRATGKLTRYTTTAGGLPGNSILRILEDRSGSLWVSTFNGLGRFDPRTGQSRNFYLSDGLQSNQFGFNAALALQSGEFLFGGIKGFNLFYPDSIQDHEVVPPLFLDGLRVDDNPTVVHNTGNTRQIILPYESGLVSIDFLALCYFGSEKINYAWCLQGWDKGFNYVGSSRTANFSRLQEGDYTFLVKATNTEGKWGPATSLLHIRILPPWYRTWWAWMLYVLSIGAAIFLYVNYTRNKERMKYEIRLAHLENEKEKEIAERKFSWFTHISHEFRTPLTLIISPLKQWIRTNPADAESTGLTTAYRNARRLLSLMDQLLLFRKADSNMDKLNPNLVDLTGLCREVHALFLQQAKARQIDYQLDAPLSPVEIYADYEKLEIALFNLLSNAFKFTPEGGKISFTLKEEKDSLLFTVTDSGYGIDEKEKAFIFDKFRQGEFQNKAAGTGFGIGLFLVRHFIQAHKGNIRFESQQGKGTSFFIELPRQALRPNDAPPARHRPGEAISSKPTLPGKGHSAGQSTAHPSGHPDQLIEELAADIEAPIEIKALADEMNSHGQGRSTADVVTEKKSILVIDDNKEIRQYLRQLFAGQYLVLEAESGEEGLTLAENQLPDLILSDVQMGEMDGITLCARIKQSESLGHIPVILLTAATGDEMRLKGLNGGADDYITKPFDAGLLQAKIESVLRNRNILQRYFFDSITLRESSVKVPLEYKNFLFKCIEVIEDNIDKEDFNIKKFSKAMGMSHRTLYHKIKSISGQSAVAFIRQIRLRRAAVLMLREDMNINQAAFQVGMADVKYFREQFVKTFGTTPSEYIKKYRPLFNRDLTVIPSPQRENT